MKQSESIAALAKALVAAQGEFKTIAKDATNPHFRSKFASLEGITEAIRPTLAKNKLAVVQGGGTPISDEAGAVTAVSVESMLLHESGEWISTAVTMPLDKATPQGVGSAVTYGRRYGLSALLAIVADDDDDGEAAAAPSRNAAPRTSNKAAADKVMPFGKTKGKRLGELSEAELNNTLKWCQEKDAAKFADLIEALGEVLADRAGGDIPLPEGEYARRLDDLLDHDAKDLPFK